MSFLTKLQSKDAVIGVVGLGYVGLPLILAFAAKGFRCVGFDIDASKVAAINAGTSYIAHIDALSPVSILSKPIWPTTAPVPVICR